MISGARTSSKIPELKRRILITFVFLAQSIASAYTFHAWDQWGCPGLFLCSGQGTLFSLMTCFQGSFRETFRVCPGNYAVHQRLDHFLQLLTWSFPILNALPEGRRDGPKEDHPIYALWTVGLSMVPGIWDRRGSGEYERAAGEG